MANENRSQDDEILALIKSHEPLLRHIIQSNVHNPVDVEDIFQETVLAIIEHFRKGRPVKHPKAWMARIAKNKCIDFHRRAKGDTNRNKAMNHLWPDRKQ